MKTLDEQVKAIRLAQIAENERVNTCGQCGFSGVFMYTLQGEGLCPDCDCETIENFKNN